MDWKFHLVRLILVLLSVARARCTGSSSSAKLLLEYDQRNKQFILHNDALNEIEYQTRRGPVKVIGAVGDARVGKSTNLNFISYFLDGNTQQRVQKVFKTSDSMEPCTTGVWMSVLRDPNGAGGSTILIDTEGTNLGDNEITDLLSIFTVLMSSGLALFARDGLRNHNVEFLYRVSRLSEEIWKQDVDDDSVFPELIVILRDALSPSPGKTLQGQTQDFILNDQNNYGKTIARHFPRHRIRVRDIPFVEDPKRLNDLEHFSQDEYANVASSLAADFKQFPFKKTVNGANMDGKMIAGLSRKLTDSLNRNSWSGFSDTYLALETNMCARSFQEIVEPLLRNGLDEIKNSRSRVEDRFMEKCGLAKEIASASDKISQVIAEKEEVIKRQRQLEEQRRRQDEEERKEREREAERRRIALERERRLQEEQRERERAEEQVRIQQENLRRAEEERRRLEAAAAKQRSRDRERRDIVNTVLGVGAVLAALSDSRLKENITAIPLTEFEEIGLQGYSWVWSEKAAEELGMRGIEHGVIAQEVEKLYPWVVVTGNDGYKRVHYGALKELVEEKRYADGLKTN